ncbi:MAG: hypothetical protein ACRYFK_15015 [Janthinobacterium lividum]
MAGYGLALLGGLFSSLVGAQLYFHRRALPDGRRTYAYSAPDQAHGLQMLVLGAVVFGLSFYSRMPLG